jgi:Zn-dependent protease
MGRGVRAGRPFGIPLVIDLSWLITMVLAVAATHSLWRPLAGVAAAGVSVAFWLVFFASVVAHELAHALVARALGILTADITLFVFGGTARITAEPDDAGDEALIAMAGPLVSVTIAGVGLLLGELLPGTVGEFVFLLGLANLVLALFNLLPGFPLDGGRVVRALLWRAGGRRMSATRIAAWGGRALAGALVLGGIVAALVTGDPRFLLDTLLGVFLWQAAGIGERAARAVDRLSSSTVGDYMTRAVPTVPAWTIVADVAARGLAPVRESDRLVVIQGDGRPLGLLNRARLIGVPVLRWPNLTAGALAEPVDARLTARVDERADRFLSRYLATGGAEYLVLDRDGRPAGIVDGPAASRLRLVSDAYERRPAWRPAGASG